MVCPVKYSFPVLDCNVQALWKPLKFKTVSRQLLVPIDQRVRSRCLHFLKKEKRLTLKYSEIFEELFIFSSFRGFWQQVPDFEKMEIKRKPKNFTQLTSADSWDHDAAPCAPEVICRAGSCSSGRCCAYENSTDISPWTIRCQQGPEMLTQMGIPSNNHQY